MLLAPKKPKPSVLSPSRVPVLGDRVEISQGFRLNAKDFYSHSIVAGGLLEMS